MKAKFVRFSSTLVEIFKGAKQIGEIIKVDNEWQVCRMVGNEYEYFFFSSSIRECKQAVNDYLDIWFD